MKKNEKQLKKLIKEAVQETLREQERFEPSPPISLAEKDKDKLQTAMLHGARKFFEQRFFGGSPGGANQATEIRVHAAYSDLEDLLVDAMMNYNVPLSPGIDSQ